MIPKYINIQQVYSKNLINLKNNYISDNIFISKDKKKLLKKKYKNIYNVKHNNTNIYFLQNNYPNQKLAKLIIGRVNFSRELFKNNKPLTIWIWNTPWKKSFPINNTFTVDNINSGSTISNFIKNKPIDNGIIFIWRKEELLKVLVHEIIHAFHVDMKFKKNIEAQTELYATYMNTMLELLERNLPIAMYNTLIEKEKKHSLKMSCIIKKYNHGQTNVNQYIYVKGQLLHVVSNEKWKKLTNKFIKISKKPKELKMTITNKILHKLTRT